MKRYRLDWTCPEFVQPQLDPLLASCRITNKPAMTNCAGFLHVRAGSDKAAVKQFMSNPSNRRAVCVATEV